VSSPASTHRLILKMLKEKQGAYVSGALLAGRLGLTRTGIWKNIRTLRSMGYDIQSHPKEGYRLVSLPDLLLPDEILPELKTAWLGRSYHYFPQIGSTNDHALALAAAGAPHGSAVCAEEQTSGRGRLRREWISSPRLGIYLSILLRTPLPVQEAFQATYILALSLVKVLRGKYGLPGAIKWPNDILIGPRKVGGILTEMQSDQDFTRFLVIGIGINVNHTKEDLAGPFRYPATSLAIERGDPVARRELLITFLERLESDYDTFYSRGFSTFLADLEQFSGILGKYITIVSGKEEKRGKALRFTPEGALILGRDDGTEEAVWVGDVTRVEGTF